MSAETKCKKCGAVLETNTGTGLCPVCGDTEVMHKNPLPPAATTASSVDSTVILAVGSRPAGESGATQPAQDHGLVVGRKFGDYEILSEIAQGGMGIVYKARQLSLNRLVALKMIIGGPRASKAEVKRLHAEAESASNLDHPNIVPIFEVGEHGGRHYFTMRLIEGGNLEDHAEKLRQDPRQAVRLLVAVARAVHYAHQRGVLHRDLKPANILMDASLSPHVTDFGLATRVTATSDAGESQEIIGSPNYMSPEQASPKNGRMTTTSDVFSLGAVLYWLLTGKAPFEAETPVETLRRVVGAEPTPPGKLNSRVDRDLDSICLKCLSKRSAKRYGSAEALADDLDRWLRMEPTLARPVTGPERLLKWARRRPAAAALVFVTLTAAITLVLIDRINTAKLREQMDIADHLKTQAEEEGKRAVQAAAESRLSLTRLNVGAGLRHLLDNDASASLLWFVEALRLDMDNPGREQVARIRLGSVLRQCPKLASLTSIKEPILAASSSQDGRFFVTTTDKTARVSSLENLTAPTSLLKLDHGADRIALSSDGRRLAVAGTGHTPAIYEIQTRKQIPLTGHQGAVLDITYSPDGTRVATAGADGTARLWDAATGVPKGPPLQHKNRVFTVAFSADGARIVTASRDHSAQVWDVATGNKVGAPMLHGSEVVEAQFSPNGDWIVTASQDRTARVWETATGKPKTPPLPQSGPVLYACFSPDGRRVVTANQENVTRVWDASSGEPITGPMLHNARVSYATFSPSGRYLLTVAERQARVWEASTGRPITPPLLHFDEILHAAFSPEGNRVVTASKDQAVRVWELITSRQPPVAVLQHQGPVNTLVVSPNGQRVATASADKTARIWDTTTGKPITDPLTHRGPVTAMAFGANGDELVTISREPGAAAILSVWDARTGKPKMAPPPRAPRPVALSLDGQRVLMEGGERPPEKGPPRPKAGNEGNERNPHVFDLHNRRLFGGSLPREAANTRLAKFSANLSHVAYLMTSEKEVGVLEIGGSRPLKFGHKETILNFEFSPNGALLVTASADNTARIWETATGRAVAHPLEHGAEVVYAAFSPDGSRVVTTSADNTARVWDARTSNPITPFLEHKGRVVHAAFSPDGQRVVTASWDNTACLWDAATGEALSPPLEHQDRIEFAAFGHNGRRIFTASTDGTARIWDFTPDERPAEDWVRLAHLLSGRRIDNVGSLVPLGMPRLNEAWQALRLKYDMDFASTAGDLREWHLRQAEECESSKDWFAAAFHYGRLAAANPSDATIRKKLENTRAAQAKP